jgi:predicted enzyme related to lactoylglutathione lyase
MTITWWEIQVPDLDQAKAFYGGVFGWTFKSWMDGYGAAHDGEGKGGVCLTSPGKGYTRDAPKALALR